MSGIKPLKYEAETETTQYKIRKKKLKNVHTENSGIGLNVSETSNKYNTVVPRLL